MLFSSWVSSGPFLTVTGTVLSVDPTCPVELGSLTDEDCLRPNPPDTLNITMIWAGTLGGILAIASMIMIMVTVVMLVQYSRRTKTSNISR